MSAQDAAGPTDQQIEGHGGWHMVAAAQAYGVNALYTLSGAHVFPLYDAAIGGAAGYEAAGKDNATALAGGPLRLVDVRHEATAVFAAEATAKLTRTPGFAAITAGPGVTNGVSALASAYFNGAPLVVVGGRAPQFRWGSGALQEVDHLPLVEPVTVHAETLRDPAAFGTDTSRAFAAALSPGRGPAFVDVPMDLFYTPATASAAPALDIPRSLASDDQLGAIVAALQGAERPVLILGSDVWMAGAEDVAARLVAATGIPVIANGMGRGVLPPDNPALVTRARSAAFKGADVVMVVGTPLDFRLGYGIFGDPPARVVHLVDAATHISQATERITGRNSPDYQDVEVCADLPDALTRVATQLGEGRPEWRTWAAQLREVATAAIAGDADLLAADTDPIHPARIYGELVPRLSEDTIVIGDGGDFVSFAGRFIEPARPGYWLDPGPYGCLGTGMGYALAAGVQKPSSPAVLLLGDGAAGFSLMDVETLVRHKVPTVMIVGNNSAWGLEKHPMRLLHGYDVAADLQPGLAYHDVVRALGGAGEVVTRPGDIGAALDRAFESGVPYLVNVLTDPEAAYPRSTTGL